MRSPWRKLAAGLTMALAAAVAALVPPAQAATGIIIAIDPGHGGSDPGAVANGLQEKDLTLAVSLALKEELETYDGVTVVMTRTSDTRPSENLSDDLSSRVQMAAAADADALVSIHFNSGSPIARGAEVWYGNSSSYNYATHTQGRKLSTNIQDQLTSLGLADRGIKTRDNPYYDYPDGSTGDYYAIIRQAREENMPGIIVEHAFVTSTSDAQLLRDPNFVHSLGVADATGIAQTYGLSKGAWEKSGDSWRFVRDGAAKTGWFNAGGRWYWAGANGRTIRGWSTINGRRYFFDDSTAMVTGWKKDGDKWYYLRPDGDMATGWIKDGGSWYYLGSDGVMATGWLKERNDWYWLGTSGAAAVGWTKVGGDWYLFDDDARMLTGWQLTEDDNEWYYMHANGVMATGWLLDRGSWYYLDGEGTMKKGWVTVGGVWYYMRSSGAMATGWLLDGNTWYWLDPSSGAMATGTVTVEGRASSFASSGAWLGYADGAGAPAADAASRSASRADSVTNAAGQRLIMTAPMASRSEVIDDMVSAWNSAGSAYPSALASGGAPTIRDFAGIVYDEAVAEGVSPELVFVQSMKETGWLGFGGDVSVGQFNFSGIGAVGGGAQGASFPDVRTGIRAQVQHLRAYADPNVTTASLANPVVDPRFTYVRKGAAPVVEYLGIQENPNHTGWAAARGYGGDLVSMMNTYF
ncbi:MULTISPECIES: N-acetylmuramoyl-L-alanine amidase [Actinomycetaceae]|uniref:N-acetylmuramoyl-L-alanine amidase n=1 Tax=Actinomycetaceae TaxID=2049 RepID=UPI0003F95E6A|nr:MULTISPECIES: N-acetylmuramoyl-L-alanine amidase [Actinomycetaceae]WLD79083.1 N-acetylmuramoyl-L-alanine amidase [Schaalia sp. HMT-172]